MTVTVQQWTANGSVCGDSRRRGYTFVELLVVATIILILASAIMPLAKVTATAPARGRAAARAARDAHGDRQVQGRGRPRHRSARSTSRPAARTIRRISRRWSTASTAPTTPTGRKLKFLRRIPIDPMTHSTEWGLRSYQDKPDSTRWGGQNVFDVYTTFDGTALDGTKYRDW